MKTFSDVIEQLVDYIGGARDASSLRSLKRAIREAYREIANAHPWTYLKRHGRLVTQAPYLTGTITYVHSTRTVTLSGGTFPTWLAKGDNISSGDIECVVQSRTNGTTLVLDEVNNFGADISTGQAYTVFRDSFDLPADFRSGDRPVWEEGLWKIEYADPQAWLRMRRSYHTTGSSILYTITKSPRTVGRLAIRMAPAPDASETVDYIYQCRPREFTIGEYRVEDARASITSGQATVTGTKTAFSSAKMVGTILRLSDSATSFPTDFEGDNYAALEDTISAVASATQLTVENNAAATYSNVRLVISDPIDIEEGAMMNAFLRCCEKHTAIIRGLKNQETAIGLYMQALEDAKSADSRSVAGRVAGAGRSFLGEPRYIEDDT